MVWFNAYMEPKRVSLNGVFRGGFSWSSKVLYVRGGYRYGASMRSELGTALGFRLTF